MSNISLENSTTVLRNLRSARRDTQKQQEIDRQQFTPATDVTPPQQQSEG